MAKIKQMKVIEHIGASNQCVAKEIKKLILFYPLERLQRAKQEQSAGEMITII